jgi:hypothetical protein
LVERRRADLCSRGRLPQSLPPVRHGLALIDVWLGQRHLCDGGPLASRRSCRPQPYGPEHAYSSRRVSTIETTIDPAIPIPFEKNTNILQANPARPRSFRH